VINSYLSKVNTHADYDLIANALDAVKQYIQDKAQKGEKITNPAAITQAAIKGGWKKKVEASSQLVPISTLKSVQLTEEQIQEKVELHNLLQDNPTWKDIQKEIKNKLGNDDWKKWFSEVELYSIEKNNITLLAPSKFARDWIIREFVETKDSEVNLRRIVKNVDPKIEKLAVIAK
jgi:hypothetical protein